MNKQTLLLPLPRLLRSWNLRLLLPLVLLLQLLLLLLLQLLLLLLLLPLLPLPVPPLLLLLLLPPLLLQYKGNKSVCKHCYTRFDEIPVKPLNPQDLNRKAMVRWIFPRSFVHTPRISTQGFMTSSSVFVERSKAPLLPANFFFFPEFVFPRLPINPLALLLPLLPLTPLALLLPLLPMTPLALLLPLLPMTPLAPLLPPVLAPVHLALSLKQPMQNLARGEAALFLQRGLLHFFTLAFALAAG